MAIDAVIDKFYIELETNNVLLKLVPCKESDGSFSITGQDEIIILHATHIPVVRQEIWGGADGCIIEPNVSIKESHRYKRTNFGRLVEI